MNIPIYRAKSNERKNTFVEGFLIGIDEETGLCTIRTKDDYIGGEICYLHTLSIHFEDMLDSQGNKIFASLQEDGKGGDVLNDGEYEFILSFDGRRYDLRFKNDNTYALFNEWNDWNQFTKTGIQE